MICSNCKAVLPEGALFCGVCGQEAKAQQPVYAQSSIYCGVCGEKLPAGASFCKNCGAAQNSAAQNGAAQSGAAQVAQAGGAKLGGKKKIFIIAGVAAAAVLFCILLLTGAFMSPAAKFRLVLKKGIVEPARMAAKAVVGGVDGGIELSTDMTVSAEVPSSSEYADYLDGTAIDVKIDSGKNGVLAEIGLKVMGGEVLSGIASYRDGTAGIYLPELDPEYYTFDIEKVMETVSGETAAEEAGSTEDALTEKAVDSLLDRYTKIALSCINNSNVTKSGAETVELYGLGQTQKGCTVYTFEPSEKELEAMFIALSKEMRNDDELAALLNAYANGSALTNSSFSYYYDSTDEAIEDAADDLEYYAESYAEDLVDAGFRWEIVLKGNNLVRMQVVYDDEAATLEMYGTNKKEKYIFFGTGERREPGQSMSLEIEYTATKRAFVGKASVYSYGDLDAQLTVDADLTKKSGIGIYYGTYKFKTGDGESISLSVEKGDKGSRHEIKFKDISDLYYSIGTETASLILETTDKASTVKAPSKSPTDVSDYSYEELEGIIADWGTELQPILYDLLY